MPIPNDPIMLLSYINTQLRDKFSSFDELCKSLCIDSDEIREKLSSVNYEYDSSINKFV